MHPYTEIYLLGGTVAQSPLGLLYPYSNGWLGRLSALLVSRRTHPLQFASVGILLDLCVEQHTDRYDMSV